MRNTDKSSDKIVKRAQNGRATLYILHIDFSWKIDYYNDVDMIPHYKVI